MALNFITVIIIIIYFIFIFIILKKVLIYILLRNDLNDARLFIFVYFSIFFLSKSCFSVNIFMFLPHKSKHSCVTNKILHCSRL